MTRRLKPNGFFRRAAGGEEEVVVRRSRKTLAHFCRSFLPGAFFRSSLPKSFGAYAAASSPRTPADGSRGTRGDVIVSLAQAVTVANCRGAQSPRLLPSVHGLTDSAVPSKPGCCVLWGMLGLP